MRKLIITANALLRDNRRWTQQARPTAAFSCVGLGEAGWLD
jgi:hypothetical protein